MSPEQARGEELDSRSDLFSAGAVLYQAATGALPFSGKTSAVIFHAILELDPLPATQLNPSLPPKLQEIISKALEKDRELRYQTAADLRSDLKRLKRDIDSGKTRSFVSPEVGLAGAGGSSAAVPAPASGSVKVAKSPSSSVIAAARQNKFGFSLTALIALLIVVAAAYGIYVFVARGSAPPFQNISTRKITETGRATEAAISPDGKYILNAVRQGGQESLWLRNIPTNSDTQVIPSEPVRYIDLHFSSDGNYLYFRRSEAGSQELDYLYRAPMLGGAPEKLVTDIDSNITFSPDGRQFAFLRYNNPDPDRYRLIIASLDGSNEKVIASGPRTGCMFGLSWSPDGKTLVCVVLQPGSALSGLVATDVGTGQQKIFCQTDGILRSPIWLPDGRSMLVLSRDKNSNLTRNQIGLVSYPAGKYRAVTSDFNDYSDLSLSADGHTIAAVLNDGHADLYVAPADNVTNASAQSLALGKQVNSVSWTPDGQLMVDENLALHKLNPDSGADSVLATEQRTAAVGPSACPNGRYVVFSLAGHLGSRTQAIARVDAAGGNLRALTDGKLDQYAVCSPDSKWVYYVDYATGEGLMRVSIDGGTSQKVTDMLVGSAFGISPDGKLAAFSTFEHNGEHEDKLALAGLDSTQSSRVVEFQHSPSGAVRFSPDGKAVVYPVRTSDVDNLWSQPLDGSAGRQITHFTSEQIRDRFGWSRDGSKLALVRGHFDSDVVLIRDSQP
jgi:Tol biopolymer transport system component